MEKQHQSITRGRMECRYLLLNKRESNSVSKTDEQAKAKETSEMGTDGFHLCYTALSETKCEHFPTATLMLS